MICKSPCCLEGSNEKTPAHPQSLLLTDCVCGTEETAAPICMHNNPPLLRFKICFKVVLLVQKRKDLTYPTIKTFVSAQQSGEQHLSKTHWSVSINLKGNWEGRRQGGSTRPFSSTLVAPSHWNIQLWHEININASCLPQLLQPLLSWEKASAIQVAGQNCASTTGGRSHSVVEDIPQSAKETTYTWH